MSHETHMLDLFTRSVYRQRARAASIAKGSNIVCGSQRRDAKRA